MGEVFPDGVGGLYVDGRDPVEVARAILRLLDSPSLRQRFGRSGRAHVGRAFPAQAQADRYLELFTSLCTARVAA
jgi:glycosyltransferase involved in cell wall biosynthesis